MLVYFAEWLYFELELHIHIADEPNLLLSGRMAALMMGGLR
jgi:hypothetical protein